MARRIKPFVGHTVMVPRPWAETVGAGHAQIDVLAFATSKAELADHVTVLLGSEASAEWLARSLKQVGRSVLLGNYWQALTEAVEVTEPTVLITHSHGHRSVYRVDPDGFTLVGEFRSQKGSYLPLFEPVP